MKVPELSGAKLDYWVARSNGYKAYIAKAGCFLGKEYRPICIYGPSTEWDQGGPIIEREEIQLVPRANGEQWAAGIDQCVKGGDTALIAAMRCYVASKFGEDVPDAE